MTGLWADLPPGVRERVGERLGEVLAVSPLARGIGSDVVARVVTEQGGFFVKAGRVNGVRRTEVRVQEHLPAMAPRLVWYGEAEGWLVLAFEFVEGRHADFAPGSEDLPRLAEVVGRNILVGEQVRVVDWAWPTIGAAWLDTASVVVRLIQAGHAPAQAEQWARQIPCWRAVSDDAIAAFVTARTALARKNGHEGLAGALRSWRGCG